VLKSNVNWRAKCAREISLHLLYVYICIYICVYVYIFLYIYIYIYIYKYKYIYMNLHSYKHVYINIHIYTYANIHICMYTYIYGARCEREISWHIHICIHIYVHVYIFTWGKVWTWDFLAFAAIGWTYGEYSQTSARYSKKWLSTLESSLNWRRIRDFEWVMSHVWMNESCRVHEWVMSHTWNDSARWRAVWIEGQ